MKTLPSDFQFTQGNLQDYVDCPRRFQLRYLERLAWPAVESEPFLENERRLRLGAAFHRLAQQHLSGIPAARLTEAVGASRYTGTELERWWENYLEGAIEVAGALDPGVNPPEVLVETTLTAPLGDHRLVAKYDAIVLSDRQESRGEPGKITIVDWKTAVRRPARRLLAGRLQTRIYPYLLAQGGLVFEGGDGPNRKESLVPEQIEMVYWFPEFPGEPERFRYDRDQFEKDRSYLEGLASEIKSLGGSDFPLTPEVQRCAFCTYRSLCDRGVRAGSLDEFGFGEESAEDLEFTLDFDQIAEVEF
jgi:hypothetical protein